jgi:hypothetical protein
MVISWCLKDCLLNMSLQGYCSATRRAGSLAQEEVGTLGRGHMFRTVLSVIACSSFSSCYLSHMWRPMSQIFFEIVSFGRLGSDLLYRLCLGVLGMFRRVWYGGGGLWKGCGNMQLECGRRPSLQAGPPINRM